MSPKWLIVVLAAGAVPAGAQVPKPGELHAFLASIVKQRGAEAANWTVHYYSAANSDDQWRVSGPLPEPEARRFAIPLSFAKPDGLDPTPYRKALIAALRDPDPEIRGAACEVAAMCWDLKLLPALGALLDDNAWTRPWGSPIRSTGGSQQSGTGQVPLPNSVGVRPPVGYMARMALSRMTGIYFSSRALFDRWMSKNRRPQSKLWYWAAKWNHRWTYEIAALFPHDERVAAYKAMEAEPALDLEFRRIARRSQLWVFASGYRAYVYQDPLQEELVRDLGGKRVTDSVGAFTSGASRPPRAEEISRFLHERGFRKELLACLTTPDLAKSPADPDRVLLAILAATDGAALFEAEDEPVLAKAQAQPEFPQVVGDMVATLRAKLVPSRSATILGEYVASHPDSRSAAAMLAENYGESAELALLTYYWRADQYHQRSMVGALSKAFSHGVPVTREFLLKLLEPPTAEDKAPIGTSLAYTADLAKSVVGADIVNREDVRALETLYGKMQQPPDWKQEVEAASEKVRAELIAGLKPLSSPPAK